jgi:adenine-specific DNA-methyltransferase
MATLNWIGKEAVVNHHRKVPVRLLECDRGLSAGDPEAGNLLVEGDNLEALKALLPRYRGQVKCIYIDPPYNTGNEACLLSAATLKKLNITFRQTPYALHKED